MGIDVIKTMYRQEIIRQDNCEIHNIEFNIVRTYYGESFFDSGECPECKIEREKKEVEEQKQKAALQAKQRRIKEALENGIGEKYIDCTLDNYEHIERVPKVVDFYNEPKNKILLMVGTNGTGKTHLGSAIAFRWRGLYYTFGRLLRKAYNIDKRDEVTEQCIKAPMLVIDEIGKGSNTDFSRDLLYTIVDERYLTKKPSVLITNLQPKEFVELVGKSFISRIKEVGVRENMIWDDFREKNNIFKELKV